jgi:predicted histone-like DNA-binding protein
MSVNYKPVPKKNPAKQTDPPKYYAQVVSSGDMSLRQLAKEVAATSSMGTADTMAIIEAFLQIIPKALGDGKIVRLGDFGSFSLSASSEGMATADQLTSKDITKRTIKFRAGKELSKAINDIEFHKTND